MGDTGAENTRRDLAQRRAEKAWGVVKTVKDRMDQEANPERKQRAKSYAQKYATLTQSLTQMIQVNGLAATVAFLRAKAGDKSEEESHHQRLYNQLSGWLCDQAYKAQGNADLLTLIIEKGSDDLRRATAEAIAFSIWLRRFSEAEFGDVRGETQEEQP